MAIDKKMSTLIALVTYLFSGCLQAQYISETDFIALKTGDTLTGKVAYINEDGWGSRTFYKKIRITLANGKKKKIRKRNITSFKIDGTTFMAFELAQHRKSTALLPFLNPYYSIDTKDGDLYFLRVVSNGKLNYYELEWFDQGDDMLNSMPLLRKNDASVFVRATQGMLGLKRKALISYLNDCPKLGQKITSKEIRTVREVVNFYNNQCD